MTSNFFRCTMHVTLYSVIVLSNNTHETTKNKRLSDVSVPKSWHRWAHSVSHTRLTVERGINFRTNQNRDAAANCWRLAPVTHAGRAASSPEIFRPFSAVCLTVFPLEFWPRTFTIRFNGKKSFLSELMILECSFPLNHFRSRGRHSVDCSRFQQPDNWLVPCTRICLLRRKAFTRAQEKWKCLKTWRKRIYTC